MVSGLRDEAKQQTNSSIFIELLGRRITSTLLFEVISILWHHTIVNSHGY